MHGSCHDLESELALLRALRGARRRSFCAEAHGRRKIRKALSNLEWLRPPKVPSGSRSVGRSLAATRSVVEGLRPVVAVAAAAVVADANRLQ